MFSFFSVSSKWFCINRSFLPLMHSRYLMSVKLLYPCLKQILLLCESIPLHSDYQIELNLIGYDHVPVCRTIIQEVSIFSCHQYPYFCYILHLIFFPNLWKVSLTLKKIVLNIFNNYSMTRFQEEYMQGSLATSLIGREGGIGQHSEHWWAWNVGADMCVHVRMYTHTMLYVHTHTCIQCCMCTCACTHT